VIRLLASAFAHVLNEEKLDVAFSEMPGVDSDYTIDWPVVAVSATSARWIVVRARWGAGSAPRRDW
jgi:hypothetical protein